MPNKVINSQNAIGFTLMETIVSMAIFAILLTLVFANFRQSEKQDDLSQSAVELAGNLRKVQNLGMSGQVTKYCKTGSEEKLNHACINHSECGDNGKCDFGVPKGGYGIHFDQEGELKNYTLFIDLSGDLKYDTNEVEDDVLPGGKDYQLKGKVVVLDYDLRCAFQVPSSWGCPAASDNLDVLFMPPKPTPWATTYNATFSGTYEEEKVYILLKHPEINKCARVSVNGFSGDVSVEPDDDCELTES